MGSLPKGEHSSWLDQAAGTDVSLRSCQSEPVSLSFYKSILLHFRIYIGMVYRSWAVRPRTDYRSPLCISSRSVGIQVPSHGSRDPAEPTRSQTVLRSRAIQPPPPTSKPINPFFLVFNPEWVPRWLEKDYLLIFPLMSSTNWPSI